MGFRSYIWDEEFNLNVSMGRVRGAEQVHKLAATPIQSINLTASLWDKPDTLYPWSAFITPGVLISSQVNSSDNGKQVVVEGLDNDWNRISEIFTLSSSESVTGTQIFRRIIKAYLISQETNDSLISFSRSGVEVARINIGIGQTLMGVYTIPLGYTGYLYQGTCSAQAGADATGFMMVRLNGSGTSFLVGHTFEVSGGGGQYDYKFTFPQVLPEKTDIDIRLSSRSNNGRYTAAFDILLIKNEI